ncbi:MAG: ATP-binding protein [Microthrixaceae bacterium]
MSYLPRLIDAELRSRLKAAGAVVIEGAKATGKTETARQVAESSVLLDVDREAQRSIEIDPALLLVGAVPRLLDEWQLAPGLWNLVRRAVDDRQAPGQFILTGSSVPDHSESRHTGAGRFSFLRQRTMSWFESGHSSGAVSLRSLLGGNGASVSVDRVSLNDVAEWLTVGGWPAWQGFPADVVGPLVQDYVHQAAHVDVQSLQGGRGPDPIRVGKLMRSLARNVATEVSISTLAADAGGAEGPLARSTVDAYLDSLERLMVIEDQAAWAPHLRSKARLRKAPKRHFVDPSLAIAAIGSGPDALIGDLEFFGQLFESLAVRDLRVYGQPLRANVLHYRDSNGLEVDAVIELPDGRWGAFEVKLGSAQVDVAAQTLLQFAATVDSGRQGEPAVLGAITNGSYGYRRDDGVVVIPLTALGP